MIIVRRLSAVGGGGGDTVLYAPFVVTHHAGAAVAMANAAANAEFGPLTRRVPYFLPAGVDCWAQVYASGGVNGSSTIKASYTKNDIDILDLGATCDITAMATTTVFGAWAAVPEDAKGDYVLVPRVNGDGAADPSFSSWGVLFTFDDPT